jgi:hypothetical protein
MKEKFSPEAVPEPEKLSPKERAAELRKEIKKNLESEVNEPLKENDFEKQGMTWRRDLGKIVQILNLQRSHLSHEYFVNVGIFIKEIAKEVAKEQGYDKEPWFSKELDRPDESAAQISHRIERLMPEEERKIFGYGIDFEGVKTMEEAQKKIQAVREVVEKYAIPFFDSMKTYADLKKYVPEKYSPGRRVEDFLKKK